MMPSDTDLRAALHEMIDGLTHRSMRSFIGTLKASGLSMSQIGALFHINRRGACRVTDISEDLGITNAAVSQMLDRLVQQGLILRSEDPRDRRLKQIVLTDKGNQILQDSIRARYQWLDDLADHLSDDEREKVVVAMKILIEKAGRLEMPPNLES